MSDIANRLSIAPMMELTDRHFRYLARRLTRCTELYTEMLTTGAVLNGDKNYLLGKDAGDNPVVLQLGGSDPVAMAEAASVGEAWNYDAININVGCPSDRVKSGRFGACLMAEPKLVGDCVKAMQASVNIPVTVKCRLGIDRDDSYEALESFVDQVASAGCTHFIVHARKAWLDGLSPKENRTVPPLRYEYVYRLKQEFPTLRIDINGGITTLDETLDHLKEVDGVMIGREAYYNPAILLHADERIYNTAFERAAPTDSVNTLAAVARDYAAYMQSHYESGVRINAMSRHVVALYQGVPGARLWRRHLSENASKATDAIELVEQALEYVLTATQSGEQLASTEHSQADSQARSQVGSTTHQQG